MRIFTLLFCALTTSAFSQSITVEGRIADSKNISVPFSTVIIEYADTSFKALTDADGNFRLDNLRSGKATVTFIAPDKASTLKRQVNIPEGGLIFTDARLKGYTINEVKMDEMRRSTNALNKVELSGGTVTSNGSAIGNISVGDEIHVDAPVEIHADHITRSVEKFEKLPKTTSLIRKENRNGKDGGGSGSYSYSWDGTMEGRERDTDKKVTLKGSGKDDIISVQGISGTLTAGEISDFSKWQMWQDLSNTTFAAEAARWEMVPGTRYTVQLSNQSNIALPGAEVTLFDADKMVWQAITDNSGKAELWSGMSNTLQQLNQPRIRVTLNKTVKWLDDPKSFSDGINFLVMNEHCVRKPLPVEIAFVVDATGSMGDEIDYLKEDLLDVMQKAKKEISRDISLATVFYRDYSADYVVRSTDFTTNHKKVDEFIRLQNAAGGGDYPEAVDTALYVAVESLSWSNEPAYRIMFLLLDAPPHSDSRSLELTNEMTRRAAAKGIRIVPIVCSGARKEVEFLMRAMALATNGTYLFLTDDSGIGGSHLKPSTDQYDVHTLNALLIQVIRRFSIHPDCSGPVTETAITDETVEYFLRDETAEEPSDPENPLVEWNWTVFPNPVVADMNITFTAPVSGVIEIFDMNGKVLQQITINQQERLMMNIAPYSQGSYFVVFRNSALRKVEKIIKV